MIRPSLPAKNVLKVIIQSVIKLVKVWSSLVIECYNVKVFVHLYNSRT